MAQNPKGQKWGIDLSKGVAKSTRNIMRNEITSLSDYRMHYREHLCAMCKIGGDRQPKRALSRASFAQRSIAAESYRGFASMRMEPMTTAVPPRSPRPNHVEGWLEPPQAAATLGRSAATLARWRGQGSGPRFVKLGGRIFYRPEDIDEWLATCVRQPKCGSAG
jgi:predicted DNA-binding transcriptional regulator AlpA